MKPLILTKKLKNTVLLNITFLINTHIGLSQAITFNDCFNEKQDIIELANLQLCKPKPKGGCTGGIYRDVNHTYYVKQSNPFTELTGSKLMNAIIGQQFTPIVKVVVDQVNHTASLELPCFQTQRSYNEKYEKLCKNTIGEADLDITMDFLGIVDRHNQNIGYVLFPQSPPFAARIDFDTSFSFDIHPLKNTTYNPNSNHLSLSLLYHSIKKHPRAQIINSMKKIISIPDEQIIQTIMQAYTSLSQREPTEIQPFLVLTNKLIERKNLFRSSLDNKKSPIHRAIQKQYLKTKYKMFNKLFLELSPIHFTTISKQFKIFIHTVLFQNTSNQSQIANIDAIHLLET